jgi:hypothetical protein
VLNATRDPDAALSSFVHQIPPDQAQALRDALANLS